MSELPAGISIHYTDTANGHPACEGYQRETIPASELGSPDRRLTTCRECLEVMEAEPSPEDVTP